jgi:hypothetical protein
MSRVALACAVAFLIACGGESAPIEPEPEPAALELSTFTQGAPTDPDGYLLRVDGGEVTAVAVNDTVSVPEVAAGDHRIELSGLAANCVVAGANPRTVTTTAGLVTKVRLTVRCSPTTGELRVVVSTRGIRPDLDGYLVAVNGTEQPIEANATLTVSDLPPGNIEVRLDGLAPNCRLLGSNPVTAQIGAGATAVAGFAVECVGSAEGRLLITSGRGGTFHLYGVGEDGSRLRNLTPSQAVFSGDWSPDGSRIVFSGDGPDATGIFVMNADGSGVTPLGVTGSGPRWSPDGRTIAFTSSDGVTVVDADGTNRRVLAEGRHPDWSPDGRRIAFDRVNRAGCIFDITCPVDILIMAADGTGVQPFRLANGDGGTSNPRWSPDGNSIAYVRNCCFLGPDVSGLYVVSTNGTFPRRLYGDGVRGAPVWSPDGSTLAVPVAATDGETDVLAIPRAGGTAVVLFSSTADDYPQAWR